VNAFHNRADMLFTPASASAMPRPPDNLATPILERQGVTVEFYAPKQRDHQSPHSRDELYVVARGSGWFVSDGERRHFAPGDLIFVAAGRPHRFEDFDEDFAVWVLFFGDTHPAR
jgi:mannose-6-phosphate isomerase-like protein (cupin superfamily)